jgi:PBP1b-binding outer membrane lipoprotein LpoB
VVLALTACTTQVTQAPLDASSDRSGGWSDTAEAMVKEALKQPWPRRFTQMMGRTPVVSVGTIVNRTHEQLNTQTFVKDLERALANSGQVQFVADAGRRPDQGKPAGQAGGADFMLRGVINTPGDARDSTQAGFYQVELELVDLASNVQVWQGQRKIKKL